MGFFEKVGDSVSKAGQKAVEKTKNYAEDTKVKAQVSRVEKEIKQGYISIGKCFISNDCDEYDEKIEKDVLLAKEIQNRIRSLRMEIGKVKKIKICPSCGETVKKGIKFCQNCGSKLPEDLIEDIEIEQKISDKAIQKTIEVSEISKLKDEMSDKEKELNNCCLRIGETIYKEIGYSNQEKVNQIMTFISEQEKAIQKLKESMNDNKIELICPHCQEVILEKGKFCPHCGQDISNLFDEDIVDTHDKKKKDKIVGIVSIGVVLVIVFLVFNFIFGGRSYETVIKKYIDSSFKGDAKTIVSLLPNAYIEGAINEMGVDDKQELIDEIEDVLLDQIDYLDNRIGENWSYTYEIIDEENYSAKDVRDFIKDLEDDMDQKLDMDVTEIKKVTVEVTIKTDENNSVSRNMRVIVGKIGRQWYLLNLS